MSRRDDNGIELKDLSADDKPILPAKEADSSPSSSESESDEAPKLDRKKSRRNMKPANEIDNQNDADRGVAIGSLLYAASRGDGKSVMKILGQGAVSINDGDYDKRTALHIAASDGHHELVKTLVEAGADVNPKDRWGATPLDDATRQGFTTTAQYLKSNGGSHGKADFGAELISAVSKNDLAKVRLLVESGISVNSVDYDKRTPLHIAVAERNLDIVEYLLSQNADPKAVDRFGGTPMTEANRNGIRIGEDDIKKLLNQYSHVEEASLRERIFHPFVFVVLGFQLLFIILFSIFTMYDAAASGGFPPEDGYAAVDQYYPFYMDVHVMIFIGFGFLMTFLRKYGYSAVGVNFLLACLALQWYLLVGKFMEFAIKDNGDFSTKINISITQLIKADFAAGAVLITFGALLGKTSPVQLCLLAMFEVVFYSINESIGLRLGITDLGGSYVIHMFGAYFGLAASIVLTPRGARGNSDNSAVYRSDLFAMIGTIFLWIYWPSFNAALGVGATQHRAIVNTVLSISASCVSAFIFSFVVRGERQFNMVDIQNATLAGGVAMGATADMIIHPAVAISVGFFAGMISVLGFAKLQPIVESRLGIHDTCGVHNLHGMPSIIGAITCISASAYAPYDRYGVQLFTTFPNRGDPRNYSASHQALLQFAYLGITLGIAIFGGLFTGIVTKYLAPATHYFLDDEFWEVPQLEMPYYFDKRGEILRIDEAITDRVGTEGVNKSNAAADNEAMAAKLLELETKLNNMKNTTLRARRADHSEASSGAAPIADANAQALLIQSLTQAVNLLAAQSKKEH